MANPQLSIPNKSYETQGGKVILMSYGLFSDVMRIIGDPEDAVQMLMMEPNIRDYVLRRLFTEAQKPIDNIDDLINPYDMDLNPLELDDIIAWVADHIMHFTMSTAEKTRPVVEKYADRIASLNPSKTGSQD